MIPSLYMGYGEGEKAGSRKPGLFFLCEYILGITRCLGTLLMSG